MNSVVDGIAQNVGGPDRFRADPVFFPISTAKLAVLSVCTLGLYQLYWFYRNWEFVRKNEHSRILPVCRALFAPLFCYAFFRRVRSEAREESARKVPAEILAIGWIVAQELWLLPKPYWLMCYASFLFLLPAQHAVNSINEIEAPRHKPNRRFRMWNLAVVIIGSVVLALIVIGALIRT